MRQQASWPIRWTAGTMNVMDTWRAQHRRRRIALWAIAGLLCQVILSAWHTPLMALALGADGTPTARTVIICTGSGFRLISFDQDSNPIEVPDWPNFGMHCQMCGALGDLDPAVKPSQPTQVARPTAQPARTCRAIAPLADRRPHVRCGLDPPHFS
ncbi:MAG: hypothetical protein JXQ99_05510 [Hyphomicrobiaceae bacterium]